VNADQLSRPLLGALLLAGILALAGGAAAPEVRAVPPLPPLASGAALFSDLEVLHLRAHAAADRLAEWDVGVHPLAPPRTWKVATR
jgi:hypothetical protein